MKAMFRMAHAEARRRAVDAVINAPDGYMVYIQEPTRTSDQNLLLHGLLQQLAGREWFGKKRTMLEWKVLMVSGHGVATGRPVDVVPGLEGELVNIRESTAAMSKSRLSSLVEYVQAWIANNESQETH